MEKTLIVIVLTFVILGAAEGKDPFMKGREHYLAGRYEIALITLLSAVKEQPENSDCYLYIGNIYTHKREFGKAVAYYRIGLDLARRPGIFHFNIGQALYHDGKYRESLESLRRSLENDSRLVEAWLEMGRASYQLSDRTNTIAFWQRYLVEAPNNPQADTIRKAISLLSQTNFLFPAQQKALADKQQAEEEARKQALRDRLAGMLAEETDTARAKNAAATNQRAPALTAKDVTTKVNDVTTESKDKADYDKGEDIEN